MDEVTKRILSGVPANEALGDSDSGGKHSYLDYVVNGGKTPLPDGPSPINPPAEADEESELETLLYDFISNGDPEELGGIASDVVARLELHFGSEPYADQITGFEGYVDARGGHVTPLANGQPLAPAATLNIKVSVTIE